MWNFGRRNVHWRPRISFNWRWKVITMEPYSIDFKKISWYRAVIPRAVVKPMIQFMVNHSNQNFINVFNSIVVDSSGAPEIETSVIILLFFEFTFVIYKLFKVVHNFSLLLVQLRNCIRSIRYLVKSRVIQFSI